MKNLIKALIPRQLKPALRKIYFFVPDTIDMLSGKRDEMTPPKSMIFIGDGNFKEIGDEFLEYFINWCELKPDARVLDVGCGIGRMAIPLTRYLNEQGSYEGFDIVPEGVDWCTKKITPKHPRFRFQLADVFSHKYNPEGKFKASEYSFPFENEAFDFVFLASVFTHMMPQDVDNYMKEISRVLAQKGKCLITFFLLNEESLPLIAAKKSRLDFKNDLGKFRTIDPNTPERAIAYDEAFIVGLYEKRGLHLHRPIKYGAWCGRTSYNSYQDIIIASKK